MIIKFVKHGKRYFFTKSGKEWDIEKFFDKVTEEGINVIEINVKLPPLAILTLSPDITMDQWLGFLAEIKQLKAGKMKVVVD